MELDRIVTEADLWDREDRVGWSCEGCARLFKVGDHVYGQITGMDGEEPREGDWLCISCQLEKNDE